MPRVVERFLGGDAVVVAAVEVRGGFDVGSVS